MGAVQALDVAALRERAATHQRELDARAGRLYATVPDLARRWGVSPHTVRDIPAAALPYLAFGRGLRFQRRRYLWADVERYERERKVGTPGGAEG